VGTKNHVTHAYTLECGYHSANQLEEIVDLNKKYDKSKVFFYENDRIQNFTSDLYKDGAPFFTPKIYENVGKQLVVSILDIFGKNPISRIPFTKYANINKIRQEVVYEVAKIERFRATGNILQKIEDLD
jgi:cytosolic carboxypeptidase protein 5